MKNTNPVLKNREVYEKLKKSFDKIHYENPKDPFKVFHDIEKVLKSEIDDDENVDRIYFQPIVQDYLNWTQDNYDLLRSPKRFDRLKVYHFSIRTWVMGLIQIILFGSLLVDRPKDDIRIITTPKNRVPMFMKKFDDKGNETEYWDLHTLKVIRHFITKTLDKMNNLIRS